MPHWPFVLSTFFLLSCAQGKVEDWDGSTDRTTQDRAPDSPGLDVGEGDWSVTDRGMPDSCSPGTPDHCGRCGDRCPGPDSTSTSRICLTGRCNLRCEGDYYDVNGDPSDGCEFEDDAPAHDSAQTAKVLSSASDCDAAVLTTARLPSDDRDHGTHPARRPHGRADWFEIRLSDDFLCTLDGAVTARFVDFPPDIEFKVLVRYICDSGIPTIEQQRTVKGGSSIWIVADTGCTLFGDDSGKLVVSVEKLEGPHADAEYTLEVQP